MTPAEETHLKFNAACDQIAQQAKRHREYDGPTEPVAREIEQDGRTSHTNERAMRFNKYGREIMQVQTDLDDGDYDWPELTQSGSQYLQNLAEKAALEQGITLADHDAKVIISPQEKGWVSVGYLYHVS